MNKSKFYDSNNKRIHADIIFSFQSSSTGKMYVLYTLANETALPSNSKYSLLHLEEIREKNEYYLLYPIKDEKEWQSIQSDLNKILSKIKPYKDVSMTDLK